MVQAQWNKIEDTMSFGTEKNDVDMIRQRNRRAMEDGDEELKQWVGGFLRNGSGDGHTGTGIWGIIE